MTRAEYKAKKRALLAEIEHAFSGVSREDGIPLSVIEFAKYLTPDAQEQLRLLGVDRETRWQDIPNQLIDDYGHSLLTFTNAQGLRYYLPAFLTRYLRSVDRKDEDVHSAAFLTLDAVTIDLRPKPEIVDYQREKLALITPDQARVIARFLKFRIERLIFLDEQGELDDASADYDFHNHDGEYRRCKRALENHWEQFLDGEIPTLSERQLTIKIPPKLPDPHKLALYEARKQALIEEIERVFDGVEREDGVTLHEADVIDDYGSASERAQARLLDTEARWQDVPDEDICWGSSNLSFMDEKGFHYYFPAYLVWYLRFIDSQEEGFYSNTFDSVDFRLFGYRKTDTHDAIMEYFSLFTNEQKRTIAHFLQFQRARLDFMTETEEFGGIFESEHEDIQWALDNHWGQFL